MNHASDFFSEFLLKNASSGIGAVFCNERVDFLVTEGGEDFDVALGFIIAHVEPELVELIGSGVAAVEPYVLALSCQTFCRLLW